MKLSKTFLMDFITGKTVYIDTDLTSRNFGKLFIKDKQPIEISFEDCNFSYDTFFRHKRQIKREIYKI